jgi:hypothetical protein
MNCAGRSVDHIGGYVLLARSKQEDFSLVDSILAPIEIYKLI